MFLTSFDLAIERLTYKHANQMPDVCQVGTISIAASKGKNYKTNSTNSFCYIKFGYMQAVSCENFLEVQA